MGAPPDGLPTGATGRPTITPPAAIAGLTGGIFCGAILAGAADLIPKVGATTRGLLAGSIEKAGGATRFATGLTSPPGAATGRIATTGCCLPTVTGGGTAPG